MCSRVIAVHTDPSRSHEVTDKAKSVNAADRVKLTCTMHNMLIKYEDNIIMFVRICDICRPMHVINLCTKCKINLSHTRTVVRECCKGDDQSLWEMGKFDPPPPKNPSTDAHQICVGDYVGDIYHQAKFYPNWFRGFRFCAYVISRPSAQSDSAIFGGWVLEKGYSRDARTNFDSKYVKRRGSTGNPCKEVLFGDRETNI